MSSPEVFIVPFGFESKGKNVGRGKGEMEFEVEVSIVVGDFGIFIRKLIKYFVLRAYAELSLWSRKNDKGKAINSGKSVFQLGLTRHWNLTFGLALGTTYLYAQPTISLKITMGRVLYFDSYLVGYPEPALFYQYHAYCTSI